MESCKGRLSQSSCQEQENHTSSAYGTIVLCRTEADISQHRLKVRRPYFERFEIFFELLFEQCQYEPIIEEGLGTDLVHTTGFGVRIPRLGFKDKGSTRV